MAPSSRNLQSNVKMSDGSATGPMESSKPKPPRMSVCQRSTAAAADTRMKATNMSKNGTGFKLGGEKLNTEKSIAGSAPKRGAAARSDGERANDAMGAQAAAAASVGRAQARGKAAICESDGVLFDKQKRQSFMPESRKMNLDASSRAVATKDGDSGRKAFSDRDHTSSVFSSSAAPEHRSARVCHIKYEAPSLPASIMSEATAQAYKAMNASSDVSQTQRTTNRMHQNSSSIFSGNSENVGGNFVRPTTASSIKTAGNIFAGGAFANDASSSRPATSAASRPALNLSSMAAGSGGGGMASARASSQAALRGNGGLW
mmetsp:Transcript_50681/g.74309  ORF Transcript_50681/g.74309 Transcript_50681/m.74309 type:complete len:317 (-) Transcript_50681:302-1252(-)